MLYNSIYIKMSGTGKSMETESKSVLGAIDVGGFLRCQLRGVGFPLRAMKMF